MVEQARLEAVDSGLAPVSEGSCVPLRDFPLLVDLYRERRLRLDALITTCGLDEINDALERIESGDSARNVVVFSSG